MSDESIKYKIASLQKHAADIANLSMRYRLLILEKKDHVKAYSQLSSSYARHSAEEYRLARILLFALIDGNYLV